MREKHRRVVNDITDQTSFYCGNTLRIVVVCLAKCMCVCLRWCVMEERARPRPSPDLTEPALVSLTVSSANMVIKSCYLVKSSHATHFLLYYKLPRRNLRPCSASVPRLLILNRKTAKKVRVINRDPTPLVTHW